MFDKEQAAVLLHLDAVRLNTYWPDDSTCEEIVARHVAWEGIQSLQEGGNTEICVARKTLLTEKGHPHVTKVILNKENHDMTILTSLVHKLETNQGVCFYILHKDQIEMEGYKIQTTYTLSQDYKLSCLVKKLKSGSKNH